MNSPHVRLPAEWEPIEALWLAWPHNQQTWPGKNAKGISRFDVVPEFFARWVETVAESTTVNVLAAANVASTAQATLRKFLGGLPHNLTLVPIETNDCWIRDYGPTFVCNLQSSEIETVDWRYNAWGGKYPPWNLDDAAAGKISQFLGLRSRRSKLCLEGGAIESDGSGRLLTFP